MSAPAESPAATAPAKVALIVVDVQNDFLPPTGSLQVPGGLEVVPAISELLDGKKLNHKWDLVVASQDFHPEGHISFASSHPGHKKFQTIETRDARGFDYEQMLWPDHCIQGTRGSEIHADLLPKLQAYGDKFKLIRKGFHKGVEAYSAFDGVISDASNPPELPTEIDPQPTRKIVEALRAEGIKKVVVVGLAGDFCVSHTALSALSSRFDTAVYLPATRAINGRDADENFDKLVAFGGTTIGNKKSDRWADQLNAWIAK
ncbi:hypothetical protein Q8F55_003739 [Vanrija albida]|uniref:nicotinamidase n=1 Tax=Vanrija albida TaxID=181172 RepID=A0ABR3Q5C3_9TREE